MFRGIVHNLSTDHRVKTKLAIGKPPQTDNFKPQII